MKKVQIYICNGTSCFVMGASKILALEFNMPKDFVGKVDINAVDCMEFCKDIKCASGPCVKVDGELIKEASVEKVVAKIRKVIDNAN